MDTLLVLSGDPAVGSLLRQTLDEFVLLEAASAEQALRLFIDRDRQIDLLITGLMLPTSSGIHVALILRIELPDLPVVLTSRYSVSGWNNRDFADLKRLGSKALEILKEPFDAQALATAVQNLMRMPHPQSCV